MRLVSALSFLLLFATSLFAQPNLTPLLRVDIDQEAVIPGQPAVLRVTVLVPTWMPEPPTFESFEVPDMMVRLPERASGPVSETIDGETWSGVSRAYRIYPMIGGKFTIPPRQVTVVYADPDTREPQTLDLQTDPIVIEAVPPEESGGLEPFIAAKRLTIEQEITGTPAQLSLGDAVKQTIVVNVEGTSPLFLPELLSNPKDGPIAGYPDEPIVVENVARDGSLNGERKESITYVAQFGGDLTIPPVTLKWFNLTTNEIEVVEIPGVDIHVDAPSQVLQTGHQWRQLMPLVAIFLVMVVLSALVWWQWPKVARYRNMKRQWYEKSETFAFKQAVGLLRAQKFSEAFRAIERWRLRAGQPSIASMPKLNGAISSIGQAEYGMQPSPPQKTHFQKVISAMQMLRERQLSGSKSRASLPSLNPGSHS